MMSLNSTELVEIENAFLKVFELDQAVLELKYIINEEQDENMKNILTVAQNRLAKERSDSWLRLCVVVVRYTNPPYMESTERATAMAELVLAGPLTKVSDLSLNQRIDYAQHIVPECEILVRPQLPDIH